VILPLLRLLKRIKVYWETSKWKCNFKRY